MAIQMFKRYVISLIASGDEWPCKLSSTNDITISGSKLDWADLVNNNLAELNPYARWGSRASTVSIPSGFNDVFDFTAISGSSGSETSGYLYSGFQSLGVTVHETYEAIWTSGSHLDDSDNGNIGFVCSSLYDWAVEIPSGVWRTRYINDEERFNN